MEMYSETVLRYYELPPNKSKIPGADKHAHVDNPLCGDEITVYLKIKGGTNMRTWTTPCAAMKSRFT